jgi:hypothetical protein
MTVGAGAESVVEKGAMGVNVAVLVGGAEDDGCDVAGDEGGAAADVAEGVDCGVLGEQAVAIRANVNDQLRKSQLPFILKTPFERLYF